MGKFLYKNDAIVTVMVQSDEPDGIKALMDKAAPSGAEAFGVQTETLSPEFKTEKILRELLSYKSVRPMSRTTAMGRTPARAMRPLPTSLSPSRSTARSWLTFRATFITRRRASFRRTKSQLIYR